MKMQKRYLLICFLFLILLQTKNTYSQQLSFTYDAAGNQTERRWVCINCPSGKSAGSALMDTPLKLDIKVLDTAQKTILKRTIIASPNPVSENLSVNWQAEAGVSVKRIMVFNIGGTRTHEINPAPNQNSATLSFSHLAAGTYILQIIFSDQRKENIKVIKK